jgi:hypothetical protein
LFGGTYLKGLYRKVANGQERSFTVRQTFTPTSERRGLRYGQRGANRRQMQELATRKVDRRPIAA